IPAWSFVVALNSLQNAMMLTPCWPSAGPTGGAGFACPAGICSLICPTTFFAISLSFFHFPILEFHRRIAAEHVHRHLQFALVRVNLLDHAAEVQERSVVDLDRLPHLEADLRFFSVFGLGDLRLDNRDLVRDRKSTR